MEAATASPPRQGVSWRLEPAWAEAYCEGGLTADEVFERARETREEPQSFDGVE